MLEEASRNRVSGISARGLRGALPPLRGAQWRPGTARTSLASDSAISGVNGGFAGSSLTWGGACAKSSRGTQNGTETEYTVALARRGKLGQGPSAGDHLRLRSGLGWNLQKQRSRRGKFAVSVPESG